MSVDQKDQLSEELKSHGTELATKIRFLREEIREGRNDGKNELRQKVEELGALCPADASVAKIIFEVFDVVEKGEEGVTMLVTPHQSQCLRMVEVNNPKRSESATGVKTISLLPSFRSNTENLDRLTSNILPQQMGGI